MSQIYRETFDDGPGGWVEIFRNGQDGIRAHERNNGALVTRGPWWIDYNHAPPGGGYLHLLYCLHTAEGRFYTSQVRKAGGTNRFMAGRFPTDFRDATLTVRMRGTVELRGAQCLLLVQADMPDVTGNIKCVPFLLTGQPISITGEWSQQSIALSPDPAQWKCLGSRHDRGETYGWGRIEDGLRDVNCNLMLVLHPLDIQPGEPVDGDHHLLRAGEDYRVDQSRLPNGFVMLDWVSIEFPTR